MFEYFKGLVWLLKLLTPKRQIIFLAIVCLGTVSAVLEAISILAIIPIIQLFYDTALMDKSASIADGPLSFILESSQLLTPSEMLWTFSAVFGLSILLKLCMGWGQLKFIQNVGHLISLSVLNSFVEKKYHHVRDLSSSEITSLSINKCNDVVNSLISPVFSMTTAFMLSLFIIFGLFSLVGMTFLILLMGICVFYWVMTLSIRNFLNRSSILINNNLPRLINILIETYEARREIELGFYRQFFLKNFITIDKKIRNTRAKILFLNIIPKNLIELLFVLLVCFIVQFHGVEKIPDISILISLLLAFHRTLPLVNTFFIAITNYKGALASIEEVIKFTKVVNSKPDTRKFPNWEQVRVLDFLFEHPGERNKRQPFSASFKKGQTYFIQGESGSGKSTFVDCLTGIEDTFDGEIRITQNGVSQKIDRLFENINVTLVTQKPFIHWGTIAENISLNCEFNVAKDALKKTCYICGINFRERGSKAPSKHPTPNKWQLELDKICGENGAFLSGGQRQRVALARALTQRSEIIILDEALSGLDKKSEKEVLLKLIESFPDCCIIYISHGDAAKHLFDHIIDFNLLVTGEKLL